MPVDTVRATRQGPPGAHDARRVFVPAPPIGRSYGPPPRRSPASPQRDDTPVSRRRPRHAARNTARFTLHRLTGVVLTVLTVLVAVVGGSLMWVVYRVNHVDRIDLDRVLAVDRDAGTNYLLVGVDRRPGQSDGSVRTDTIMVLRTDDGPPRILSIPRDLWLPIAGTGGMQRINTAYQHGPAALISTVTASLGIPVHHYVEIDFAGIVRLVDAVGGVSVNFEHPASDEEAGLAILTSGRHVLDGEAALAYLRSRHYTETIDGAQVMDSRSDLGRTERQRAFVSALGHEIDSTRNPLRLHRIIDAAVDALKVDDNLDPFQMARTMRALANGTESGVVPVSSHTTSAGAMVLLVADGAEEVLERFGGGPQ